MAFTRLEPTGVNTSATFTFANANVTANLNVGGISNLGPVGNIIITGGTSGYVLSTDGSGALSWVAQSGGGGTDYSNANVAAYLPTFTGNFTAGNISTTGNITAAYFIGNGSQLTGLPESYANSNVEAFLPTYTGNVSAAYFIGNGSTLTNITGANVSGEVTFAATANSVAGANVTGQVSNALIASTVYSNAQPNITSVGSLASLTVSGLLTATGGGVKTSNIIDSTGTNTLSISSATSGFIGNLEVGTGGVGNLSVSGKSNLGPVGNVIITGGSANYVLSTNGSGTLSWVAQAAGGGSNISNGTSNVNIAASGGNVTTSVGGNADIFVVTDTGANVNGYLTVSGSFSAGSGTGGSISGANNISANYFTGNGVYLSGILGSNVTGAVSSATIAGTVTTNAQPNITSLGSLASLGVSGTSTFALSSDRTTYVSTSTSGTYTADVSSAGPVWYFTTIGGATTLNFTNLPTTDGYTTVLAAMFSGTTVVPEVQIAGSAQTIKWITGAAPTGNASGINIYTFSCVRVNSAWTAVLGSYTYYA